MKQIKRLKNAFKTKGMGEVTVVQGLFDVARNNLEACRKKKEVVDNKMRKVNNNIVICAHKE